jgi:AcrR family transcriptional regulator
MGTTRDSDETRRRTISAAGPLFADRGFDGVSIRDIVAAAGTHLSAINYHFRDKQGLYGAVLEEVCRSPTIEARLAERTAAAGPVSEAGAGVTAKARRGKVGRGGGASAAAPSGPVSRLPLGRATEELVSLMEAILADDAGKGADAGWQRRLASREAMNPSPAFRRMVAGLFAPLLARVRELLAVAGGLDESEPVVELQAMVLLATIDSTLSYAELLAELTPGLTRRAAEPGWYPRQLVAGAVAAIRAARETDPSASASRTRAARGRPDGRTGAGATTRRSTGGRSVHGRPRGPRS